MKNTIKARVFQFQSLSEYSEMRKDNFTLEKSLWPIHSIELSNEDQVDVHDIWFLERSWMCSALPSVQKWNVLEVNGVLLLFQYSFSTCFFFFSSYTELNFSPRFIFISLCVCESFLLIDHRGLLPEVSE